MSRRATEGDVGATDAAVFPAGAHTTHTHNVDVPNSLYFILYRPLTDTIPKAHHCFILI